MKKAELVEMLTAAENERDLLYLRFTALEAENESLKAEIDKLKDSEPDKQDGDTEK